MSGRLKNKEADVAEGSRGRIMDIAEQMAQGRGGHFRNCGFYSERDGRH